MCSKRKLSPILKNYLIERIITENNIKLLSENDILNIFDIDNIPFEERKKQYIDFSFIVHYMGYNSPVMFNENKIITEEASYTIPFDEVKNELIKLFRVKGWQIKTIYEDSFANNVNIGILIANFNMNLQLTNALMSQYGWSLASYGTHTDVDGMDWLVLTYDPMFQNDITDEVKEYDIIYHWSPQYNQNDIETYGLQPKSQNEKLMYPNRLHFVKGSATNEILYDIGKQLCNWNHRITNDGNYILFSVNPQKLPENIRFYYDPRYEYGYYTKQSIDSQYIDLIGKINFKTDNKITYLK